MKKLIILTLAAMLLLSMSAFATETRVLTMGENNMIIVDDANMSLFPGRNLNYPDLAIGEFDVNDDFGQFGIMWKFGDQNPWVLGTFISTRSAAEPQDYLGNDLVAWDGMATVPAGTLPENRRIDLMYGRQFNNTNFGFNFGYINSSTESDISADDREEGFTQYLLNFGLTSSTGDWDIAAGIAVASIDDKDINGSDETETSGFVDFRAVARYFHQVDPRVTLVPHAELAFGKHGVKGINALPNANDTLESKLTSFGAGVGLNYSPSRNVFAVWDFGFQWTKVTNESRVVPERKETNLVLPYWKIGLDAEVTKWLDIRLGAVSNWSNFKLEDQYKINSAINQTYLGTGMHFGRLHIDTYTDPEILLDGFNFISGSSDASNLNFQVSMLYEMF